MATHDYVIDNSTGANVRADINNVLQAILTNNSSSSAPSTTAAYMWWADTTNGVLKIRNSSNNDWVELLQLDGTLTLEDGSASTPGLAFRDDLNTGIFSSAADTFNVATAGVERMELGATTIFNEDGADVDFRIEGDSEANLFYVDAGNDRIGIGTNSPGNTLHIIGTGNDKGIDLTSTGSHALRFKIDSNASSANDTIFFQSARWNGTEVASIHMSAGADTTNKDDGTLSFHTATSGSSNTERMRIDSSGRLLLGTTTEGNSSGDDLTIATSGTTGITLRSGTSDGARIFFSDGTSGADEYRGVVGYDHGTNHMYFSTDASEAMRIDSSGNVLVGTTSTTVESLTSAGQGVKLAQSGRMLEVASNAQAAVGFNRTGDDGTIVRLIGQGSLEGTISVSGSTVSYNGGHLSRWSQIKGLSTTDKSARPTIYQGTVMSNLDDLCVWEGEDNQQLNMTKISDVEGDKDVAGVFYTWDDDDDKVVNDFYVAMTGDMVIRIAASTTVARGDLLISAGDGTAKPQADDIVRSSTIAKIISTNHTATYADGSKAYPCVLMAC